MPQLMISQMILYSQNRNASIKKIKALNKIPLNFVNQRLSQKTFKESVFSKIKKRFGRINKSKITC